MKIKIDYKRDKTHKSKEKTLCRLFSGKSEVYIFGLTRYSRLIHKLLTNYKISFKGFIDDFTNNRKFLNKPVFKSYEVAPASIVISGVIEGRPKTVFNVLNKIGVVNFLDYFDLNYIFPQELYIPYNNNNTKILNNLHKLEKIYNVLGDVSSKEIFLDILDFKLNFNYWEKNFNYSPEKQYFEQFLNMNNIIHFVDAGGYNGDTTLTAIKKLKRLKKVYFIEPNINELRNAETKLCSLKIPEIVFLNLAVSDFNGIGYFTDENGNANRLCQSGKKVIVRKLDDIIDTTIDYLKLDIEGEEYRALLGAKKLLVKYRPQVAVAVYHDITHLWKIPNFIEGLRLGYRVFIRHYTEGICETIMYFV